MINSSMVMMALGVFRFGIQNDAYQKLSKTTSYRWEKLAQIGAMPSLQYLGQDTQEVRINGVIYPHFKGGLRQVELMRLIANKGKPMMMVDGLGFVWNRWVITQIGDTKSIFLSDGAPRKIEFSMTLKSYSGGVL